MLNSSSPCYSQLDAGTEHLPLQEYTSLPDLLISMTFNLAFSAFLFQNLHLSRAGAVLRCVMSGLEMQQRFLHQNNLPWRPLGGTEGYLGLS